MTDRDNLRKGLKVQSSQRSMEHLRSSAEFRVCGH